MNQPTTYNQTGYQLVNPYTQNECDQIFGALYMDGKRVSDWGYWNESDYEKALQLAINYHRDGQL